MNNQDEKKVITTTYQKKADIDINKENIDEAIATLKSLKKQKDIFITGKIFAFKIKTT